jgi:hypothetical protein
LGLKDSFDRLVKRQQDKNNVIYAYQRLFGTDDGKAVLHDLIKSCHLNVPVFDDNPHRMSYMDGERSVVLRIIKTLEVDPEIFLNHLKQSYKQGDLDV